MTQDIFIHPTAVVDAGCVIGSGSKVWHFCHLMAGAIIGEQCNLGQNVFVANRVVLGNNVKVQNNVSLYEGVIIEDDVFCGPSCVFTNINHPRSEIVRRHMYETTRVMRGATIGANATIVCGTKIGRFSFVGAGAVVTRDVPDYGLVLGVPAKRSGWVGRHGIRLIAADDGKNFHCPESGWRYTESEPNVLRCLDWSEEKPLAIGGKKN